MEDIILVFTGNEYIIIKVLEVGKITSDLDKKYKISWCELEVL